MPDLKKDLLGLKYSPSVNVTGIEEAVVNLTLEGSSDVETVISGTVTDGSNPVVGATVKVFDKDGNPFMHTITDSTGKYSFENLTAGTYSVAVVTDGYRLSLPQLTSLNAGDTALLDFSVTKDETLSLGIATGVVTTTKDSKKLPLGGVKMSLINDAGNVIAITYTADDGEFAFYDLADGAYKILATMQGYTQTNVITVTISKGSIVNIDISLSEDDKTYTGTINGVIKDSSGHVVAGCFVGLYQVVKNEDNTTKEVLIAQTKTNSQGQYLFGDVDSGNYVVKAKKNA